MSETMSEVEELKKKIKELEEQKKVEKIDFRTYCEKYPLDPKCLKRVEFGEDGKARLVIDMKNANPHTMQCLMQSKGIIITADDEKDKKE